MTDRVLVVVPGVGVLAFDDIDAYRRSLADGELAAAVRLPAAAPVEPVARRLLDARECAEVVGLKPSTLLKGARNGTIPHHKHGRAVRFDADEVRAGMNVGANNAKRHRLSENGES